jgi:hypothetical protein
LFPAEASEQFAMREENLAIFRIGGPLPNHDGGHRRAGVQPKHRVRRRGRSGGNARHEFAAGGDLPTYIGALLPGPAPPEGDWFTRLLERWEEVQQRIEQLDSPKELRNRDASSMLPGPNR